MGPRLQRNSVFWAQQRRRECEFTAVQITCIKPAHAQITQDSSTEKGGGHEVSSVAKELLTVDSDWERGFFFRACLLVGGLSSSEGHISKSMWVPQTVFDS